MPDLPWPFKPCDEDPYHFVEIAPNEWVRVVLAGDYGELLEAYERLRRAAEQHMQAAQRVIDSLSQNPFGHEGT